MVVTGNVYVWNWKDLLKASNKFKTLLKRNVYKNVSGNKFCKQLQNNLENVLIVLTENKTNWEGAGIRNLEEMLSREWTNAGSEWTWITPSLP